MSKGNEHAEQRNSVELAQAHALLAAGRVRQSAEIGERLAKREPSNPFAWHLLSCIYTRIGQQAPAVQCAARSVSLAPLEPSLLINYGQCLVATGDRRAALAIASQVAVLSFDRADLDDALGTLFVFCEEPERAVPFFLRAVAQSPASSSFIYNLAAAQRMTGDLSAAEAGLDRAIELSPADVEAYALRSSLRTQTATANHLDELDTLMCRVDRESPAAIAVGFTLAKELEDVGRYRQSFAHLKRANDLQRKLIGYEVSGDVATIERIIQLHDRAAVAIDGGFETDECLFVMGLPRSGTTLVERILSSHTRVTAAGELQAFPVELSRAIGTSATGRVEASDYVRRALDVNSAALGRAYIEATRPQTGKTRHFVDKLPTNYLNAGLIRRALPKARMIALAREPMDSCYAMYKTRFAGAYHFSNDLADLAHYYAAWHRLLRHWQEILGENLLIVQYEDLVTRQEAVTRRILDHCGLAWQDACLEFHRQKAAVSSASAVQVRQEMYASSLGRWRHLEAELQPLSAVLSELEPPSGWRFDCSDSRLATVR